MVDAQAKHVAAAVGQLERAAVEGEAGVFGGGDADIGVGWWAMYKSLEVPANFPYWRSDDVRLSKLCLGALSREPSP